MLELTNGAKQCDAKNADTQQQQMTICANRAIDNRGVSRAANAVSRVCANHAKPRRDLPNESSESLNMTSDITMRSNLKCISN